MAKNQTNDDPSIRILKGGRPEYPEGTHPPHPPAEQDWGPNRFSYSDLPDEEKPDESSVVVQVDDDPLAKEAEEAREEDNKAGLERANEEAKQSKREDQSS
jgi:hypothetical protein